MSENELLVHVKEGLNIYGDLLDATLLIYINEVKNHMLDSGVPNSFFDNNSCVNTSKNCMPEASVRLKRTLAVWNFCVQYCKSLTLQVLSVQKRGVRSLTRA